MCQRLTPNCTAKKEHLHFRCTGKSSKPSFFVLRSSFVLSVLYLFYPEHIMLHTTERKKKFARDFQQRNTKSQREKSHSRDSDHKLAWVNASSASSWNLSVSAVLQGALKPLRQGSRPHFTTCHYHPALICQFHFQNIPPSTPLTHAPWRDRRRKWVISRSAVTSETDRDKCLYHTHSPLGWLQTNGAAPVSKSLYAAPNGRVYTHPHCVATQPQRGPMQTITRAQME